MGHDLSPEILTLRVWWGPRRNQNWSRGFRATRVRKLGTLIDYACCPYKSSALPCWPWSMFIGHPAFLEQRL